ncbi:A33 protein, partial [Loxia curvirostra]|nr:A33 protein [Loxia curvirostra]
EQVTLDPQTAHPRLILSRDRKRVWVRSEGQNLRDIPKRFSCSCSVLGTKGFMSGRHYWEVVVGKGVCWAVGVALESVPRKEPLNLHRSEKVWALQVNGWSQYRAVSMTSEVLALRGSLQRIMVCLDYEAGQVTFYNAKDMRPILQLEATFTEKVFPYFWISSGDTLIWLC